MRPFNRNDIDWVLEVMNQPSARKMFFNQVPLTKKENERYWSKKLFNRKFKAWVIMYQGKRAGVLRVDDGYISIAVDEKYRRKGLALDALKCMEGTAEVLPHNKASMKLFEKAGFKKYKIVYRKEKL